MWIRRWLSKDEFMTKFASEQEYVDAVFVQIVLLNFGVWVTVDSELNSKVG